MAVLYSFKNLFKNSFGIWFFKSSIRLGLKVTVKAWAPNIFHDKNDIFWSVNDFIEADDILVFHLLHQFDFSFYRLSPIWIEQLILFVYFHSDFLISRLIQPYPHNCISSLTDLFAYHIVVKRAFIWENHWIIIRIVSLISSISRNHLTLCRHLILLCWNSFNRCLHLRCFFILCILNFSL